MAGVSTDPLVTVVIPTFNNRWLIELCLRSMRCCTDRPFRVVVKDNGSTDGTLEYVTASGFADLVLQSSDNDFDNAEYRTYDEVIRNCVQTPFFLVCHSDMVFLQADWIDDIERDAGTDEANIMGGRLFPAIASAGWILGPWLSPWYAWGRTDAFKELNLTWQRKSPDWCARHLPEVRGHFCEQLLAKNPAAHLFWEHGGYLIALIDRCRRKIVDRPPAKVFHIGDMTGSVVKSTRYPDAPDVPKRVARVAAITQFIQRTLETADENDDDFLAACHRVVAFALNNDFAILQKYRV
jgi:glycosyltransferase involved in cell wall biosynthesis